MNEFEVMLVTEDLRKQGIVDYTLQPGNDCIWVSYRRGWVTLDSYYIFCDGKIADIQFD